MARSTTVVTGRAVAVEVSAVVVVEGVEVVCVFVNSPPIEGKIIRETIICALLVAGSRERWF